LDADSIPAVDSAVVKTASHQAGFRETPKAAPANAPPAASRRGARYKTGRPEQFNTRLTPDTLNAIYGHADRHDITMAETLGRAIASLLASRQNK